MRSRRFAALVGCAVAASASAFGAVVAGRSADASSAHVVTGAHRIIEWRAPRPESDRAARSGFFTDGGVSDVSALSHEVGEWMDDPNVVNPTKPWGNVGQVQGHCQNNY